MTTSLKLIIVFSIFFTSLSTNFAQSEKQNNYKLGDVISIGNSQDFCVEDAKYYLENAPIEPPKDKTICFAQVYIKNTGNGVLSYGPNNFSVKDSRGFEFKPYFFGKEPTISNGDLYPGEIVRGYVSFIVPENCSVLTLHYKSFLNFGKNFNVRVRLSYKAIEYVN